MFKKLPPVIMIYIKETSSLPVLFQGGGHLFYQDLFIFCVSSETFGNLSENSKVGLFSTGNYIFFHFVLVAGGV